MLIPTILMGITFPIVSKAITMELKEMGREVGNAYAINTFGAITGSISAGFVLIPLFGIKAATFVAAGLNLIVAGVMIWLPSRKKKIIIAMTAIFLLSGMLSAHSEEKTTFVTFYTAERIPEHVTFRDVIEVRSRQNQLLYYREFAEGSVRLYRNEEGYLLLQTGGKIEGTLKEDMENTLLLAYLPIALHKHPEKFLVIGLGVGVTLSAAKEHVSDLDVVEINPGVVEALRMYGPRGLFDGVNVTVDDARRFLFLTEKRYDIISSEPSYPAEATVANLFTLEFYQIAKEKLRPGGYILSVAAILHAQ